MWQQGRHLFRPSSADEAVVAAVHHYGSLVDVGQPLLDPVSQRRAGHGVEARRPRRTASRRASVTSPAGSFVESRIARKIWCRAARLAGSIVGARSTSGPTRRGRRTASSVTI